MIERFLHRLAVSSAAGTSLFVATTIGWLLAEKAGLVGRRGAAASNRKPREIPDEQIIALVAATGIAAGGFYAVFRPLLPRQPEIAGLAYAVGQSFAIRAQLNWWFRTVGRERRFTTSPTRIAGDVLLGLWLAQAERRFGPRR